jgi:hypothetical protein
MLTHLTIRVSNLKLKSDEACNAYNRVLETGIGKYNTRSSRNEAPYLDPISNRENKRLKKADNSLKTITGISGLVLNSPLELYEGYNA